MNTATVAVGAGFTATVTLVGLVSGNPITPTSVTYSIDAPTIATIDPVSGAGVGVAVGTANVTATVTANGFTHQATGTVTVASVTPGQEDFAVTLNLTSP